MQLTGQLNIAARTPCTRALGPGNRYALWVQGCPFRCIGCIAPDWIPLRRAHIIVIDDLVSEVAALPIEGISISGGEPMLQAGELAIFVEKLRIIRPELNAIVFTGFKIEQLIWQHAQNLLVQTDLLIDGLYQRHRHSGRGLRGSDNQRLHFLSEQLLPYQQQLEDGQPSIEFQIQPDGVLQVGIPPRNFALDKPLVAVDAQ